MAQRIQLASEDLRLLLSDLESGKLKEAVAQVGERAEA